MDPGKRKEQFPGHPSRVERRLEAEAEALPHKGAMRQPSLQYVVASCNDKSKAADHTVFAFAGAGIPLDKLDHPLVRAWLQKYTTVPGCLPQGSFDFSKVNGQRVLDGHRGAIRKKTTDRNTTLLFDEWTDERGVPVLAISNSGRIVGGNAPRNTSIQLAHRIGHPVGLGRLPTAANVFVWAVKLSN